MQKEGESIADYVASLCTLVEFCEFGNKSRGDIEGSIVCGLKDGWLQCRLLAESKLMFAKAFEFAQTAELVEKNSKVLQGQIRVEQQRCRCTSYCSFWKATSSTSDVAIFMLWAKAC